MEVKSTGKRYEAVCTNISEDGLAAELFETVDPKTEVTVRMLLPDGAVPLEIRGRVEYSEEGRCGVNFLDLSAEEREQVGQFVQSIS